MTSIKKKLSRYISISISILLVSILLITDISVDGWISSEFDRAMVNKSALLETLVSEDPEEVDFDFADEFMPEFSGKNDPEYFQLWLDGSLFEKSKTLQLFELNELPKVDVQLNEHSITNIILPDGRSGRMIFTKFIPQVDSDVQEEFGIEREVFAKNQKSMELAYAISNEALNQILWFVDIIFVFSSFLAIIAVRKIVSTVVEKGLVPLDKLNSELKEIDLDSEVSAITTKGLPLELVAIADGINHFIVENKALYSREKRIASDIAHELKTPIAELLNLGEVALKFPHEKQLQDNFTKDVVGIAQRLKSIVNGILLLQKSTSNAQLTKQSIDLEKVTQQIIARENPSFREVHLTCDNKLTRLKTSQFAIETILSNLINNALFYSVENTPIVIVIKESANNKTEIRISNTSKYDYSADELKQFFEPLWQKDASRTSAMRFGLGLAIVKSYCDNVKAELAVNIEPNNIITFSIVL